MSRSRKLSRAYLLYGVMIPGVAIVGVRFMGSGAQATHARTPQGPAISLPSILSATPESSPELSGVLDHIRKLSRDHGIPSPFEEAAVVVRDDERSGTADARSGSIASNTRVSAIMRVGDISVAVIDRKTWRVGEEVTPGWRLEGIDLATDRVLLRHITGATETHPVHPFD